MKTITLFLLAAGLVLAGCKKNESGATGQTNASSGNPLTAPVDYLGAVGKAKQSASKTISTVGINQAVKLFQAEHGRLPNDLQELTPEFLPHIPPPPAGLKYHYDPKTGVVKVAP